VLGSALGRYDEEAARDGWVEAIGVVRGGRAEIFEDSCATKTRRGGEHLRGNPDALDGAYY
jgi:hypothetical protein